MTQHTQGPWECRLTAAPYQQHAVWDALGRLIATTSGCSDADTRLGAPTNSDTELANARLIAAAPELLELLDEAYGELCAIECNGPLALLKTRIEAVLEKAKGEK